MKNKIFIFLLIFTLLFETTYASKFKFIFMPTTKEVFSDSASDSAFYCDTVGHWCNYAANRLYKENIFTGMRIGEKYYFQPEEQIKRGDFLLYITAVLGVDFKEDGALPFADSASIPNWQKPTAYALYNLNIIHGNEENGGLYFNYDEDITRIEAAQILNNMLGLTNNYKENEYSDSYLIPKYASGAVKNVTDYGIMQGFDDNSFRPYVKITRAMLADILCNLKDYCGKNPDFVKKIVNMSKK